MFIPLFADITKPLNELLRKDTTFYWFTQCQSAFEYLKKPILQYSNTNKPYKLFTDASNYASSGVFTQAVDGPDHLRPIAYTSGSFCDIQQRWSATKKEAFTIVEVDFLWNRTVDSLKKAFIHYCGPHQV